MMDRMTRHTLHRRHLLKGLSALAFIPGNTAHGFAATAHHQFKLGDAEISVISDGTLTFGRSFALPSTPLAEAEILLKSYGLPPDGFVAQTNVVLVRTGEDVVLIDAGSGSNFQDTVGKLSENLAEAGIDPAAVTKIVFTHAHPDHLWGAIDEFDGSPRFSNARHFIANMEWDYWTHPDTVRQVPEPIQAMAAGSARILKSLDGRTERVRPGASIASGLTLLATPGHTPGHVSLMLESAGRQLLIGGDVLSHPVISFARPDWRWGTDADPDLAVHSRRHTLEMLVATKLPLLGYHLPWPGIGYVERHEGAYRFVPA